jgi:hypothetical protein
VLNRREVLLSASALAVAAPPSALADAAPPVTESPLFYVQQRVGIFFLKHSVPDDQINMAMTTYLPEDGRHMPTIESIEDSMFRTAQYQGDYGFLHVSVREAIRSKAKGMPGQPVIALMTPELAAEATIAIPPRTTMVGRWRAHGVVDLTEGDQWNAAAIYSHPKIAHIVYSHPQVAHIVPYENLQPIVIGVWPTAYMGSATVMELDDAERPNHNRYSFLYHDSCLRCVWLSRPTLVTS